MRRACAEPGPAEHGCKVCSGPGGSRERGARTRRQGPPGPQEQGGRALRLELGATAVAPRVRSLQAEAVTPRAGRGVEGRAGREEETRRKPGQAAPLRRGPREETSNLSSHPETFPTHAGVFLTGFGGSESPSGRKLGQQTRPPAHVRRYTGTSGGTGPLGRWRRA